MRNILLAITLLFSIISKAQTPDTLGCLSGNCENGTGKYRYKDLSVYEGQWKKGAQDGKGTITLANGTFYTGDFKAGKMHGKGKFVLHSGEIMEGDFKDDSFEGEGLFNLPDGTKMGGHFENFKLLKGWIVFNSGSRYEGTFLNSQLSGFGTMHYKDSSVYIGNWKNGDREGAGELFDKSGVSIYRGDWLADKMTHPEESATYLSEKLKFYTEVLNKKYVGFQQLKIWEQKNFCKLEQSFTVEGKGFKIHGISIVTLKVDGKDYFKKAAFEGTIDPKTNFIDTREISFISIDNLPHDLKWNYGTYQMTIYLDTENKGHYILQGITKDSDAFVTELKDALPSK